MTVHPLVLGDPSHGVARLALQLLPAGPHTRAPAIVEAGDVDVVRALLPSPGTAPAVHLHLTDGLLGRDPAVRFRELVRDRRVAVTLHDVPQEAEGAARFRRRADDYREIAAAADLVVVSSHHEAEGMRRLGAAVHHVLPLPLDGRRVAADPEDDRTVGVLGWIHPGKGHDVLARELAGLARPVTLVALGAVVAGHETWARGLAETCAELGVGLRITGYLDDDGLLRAAARVRVPVSPHRHVSASGSVGSWLSAGRRPVVADGGYVRELSGRLPGALHVTDDLAGGVAAALEDPARTVLPGGVAIGPDTAEASRAQQAVLAAWAGTGTMAR